ncbi:MAG: beta strand repeat-containing protein [Limisphaerales bacterium]
MKKTLFGSITVAVLLATPLASTATTFFADTFGSGSTLNSATPGTPTAMSTDYEVISGKPWNPPPSIASGHLQFGITNTSGGTIEIQAQFPPAPMAVAGDYIQLNVTFTDIQGLLTQNSFLGTGLYNSGGVAPIGGGLNGTASSGSTTAQTGGAQNWQGYVAIIGYTGQNSGFYDRRPQTGPANNNQDLVTTGSSSQSYQNPSAAGIGTASATPSVTLTAGQQYTEILTYTLSASGALILTNQLYTGPDNTGTLLSTMTATTGTTPLSTEFDGFAFGVRSTGNLTNTLIDINSITVNGSSLPCCGPYPIGPVSVVVATNGSCAFSVSVTGVDLTYQWHRNGTNLLDGGNISGSTSAMLIISPAGTNDVASGANGYYVTVTGAGNYSINSTTNSLTLDAAANLVWSGGGTVWDVAASSNWLKGEVSAVFNYGDNVTFDDTPGSGLGYTTVNLTGNYLSAQSVTVNSTLNYTFTGSGSIAGPGTLIDEGSGPLTMNCVNSYSGGTIISNSSAWLVLDLYGALGTGPVTFAKAGGKMEVVPAGNVITGINSDVIVADDFTIQFDGNGAYSGVFFGNLSGTAGKTLTLMPQNDGTTNRFRVYGTNTVYNANLVLTGTATSQANYYGTVLAPYNPSGSQTYNGIISGNGGLVQRGSGTTILNGANTYTGGTTPTVGTIAFGIDTVTNTSGAVTSGPIGTEPLFLSPEVPNPTSSGAVMAWNGARTIANPVQYPSATNNQTLIIGGTNALTFTGPITLNGNDGTGNNTTRTFQVTNTALTTFSGAVSDGGAGFGLTKTGSGVLALNNTETYTGPTAVSNGTLQVNGQLNVSSALTVSSNATLAGTGTINGPVTVNASGTLAPGTSSATGMLAINNNLTLNGDLFFKVNKLVSPSNDVVSVSGTLANAGTGTLTVTNLGPALAVGDRFDLFNQALSGGGSLTVTGGGTGVTWLNNLSTDGSITVQTLCGPTIRSQPVGQAMAWGSSVILSVTASTLTTQTNYQWLHSATNLVGQTNRTLVITNFQPANLGSYTVLVDDGNCSILSNPANLTQAISPAFFNLSVNGTTFIMYFPTEFGPSYVIETKQNLDDPVWTPVTTYAGDGSPKVFTAPTQSYPQSFFRIRLE